MTLPPAMALEPPGDRIRPCTHCGLEVELPEPPPPAGAEVYCCHGCEAAAAIIKGAGLERYYADRDAAAPRPGASDRPLAAGIALDSLPDGRQRARFQVDGLQCAACVWVTEKVLEGHSGVDQATVSYATGRAELVFVPGLVDVDLEPALQDVAALGYEPRALDTTPRAQADRDLLLRLGIATFAAMNVMMLSAGVYLGWWAGMDPAYAALFRYVNLALATPVALWSAAPFFSAAWAGLKHRVLSMDLPISLGVAVLYGHGLLSTVVLHQEGYLDSLTMLVALLLAGRLVEQRGRKHTAEAATALASAAPQFARRWTAQGEERVAPDALHKGDLVVVGAGEALPCDGVVEDGQGRVEMALVTGESEPVPAHAGVELVAGAVLLDGSVRVRVTAAGEGTLIAQMAQGLRDAVDRPPEPDAADRIAPWFTGVTLAAAAVTFGGWWAAAGLEPALEAAVAVLVVACPCALSLARPLALAAGLGAAARRGLLFRSGDALLRMAEVDAVALDKTGTVTGGVPAVRSADPATLRVAAGLERHSIHPVARAIVAEAARRRIALPLATDVEETAGVGVTGVVDGDTLHVCAGEGAGAVDVVSEARGRLGTIVLEDQLRDDATRAASALTALDLRPTLLTGDHPEVAERIAGAAGGLAWQARLRPDDKVDWIAAAQQGGARVLFVGDGLNDGPALSAAHVGVAMGSGAASSMLASDAVVARPGLQPVVAGLVVSREALAATRGNLRRSLVYNVLAVGFAMAGMINPLIAALLMPLSSAMVLVGALRVERRTRRALARLLEPA